MIKTEKKFKWKGDYFTIQKLYGGEIGFTDQGAFIVRGFTTPPPEPRGKLFSSAPISPVEYRRKHPTRASYKRQDGRLDIYCDWGRLHFVEGPDDLLDGLVAELEAQEIHELQQEAA